MPETVLFLIEKSIEHEYTVFDAKAQKTGTA